MKLFMINYDLNSPGQKYDALISKIKTYPAHYHCLKSGWIVKSDKTAVQIANELVKHIDPNDALVVTRMTSDTAWFGLSDKGSAWLQSELQ